MGRPSLFTDETADKIVALIRGGNYRETAAAAAGIDARTLRNWLKRGAKGEAKFKEFADAMQRAEASSEAYDILAIEQAGKKDWKARAWVRERKNPRKWGQRLNIEIEGAMRDLMKLFKERLSPKAFDEVTAVLAEFDGTRSEGAGSNGWRD